MSGVKGHSSRFFKLTPAMQRDPTRAARAPTSDLGDGTCANKPCTVSCAAVPCCVGVGRCEWDPVFNDHRCIPPPPLICGTDGWHLQ